MLRGGAAGEDGVITFRGGELRIEDGGDGGGEGGGVVAFARLERGVIGVCGD